MLLNYILDTDELSCGLSADSLNYTLDTDELSCVIDSYDESHPIYKLLLDFMRLSGDYTNE